MALTKFEPADYSIQDLHFLLEHVGKPPVVALRHELPPGTHRNRLQEVLTIIYELEQIRASEDNFAWAGVEAITDSITRFLQWHDRSREILRRGARDSASSLITHPSMYDWDIDDGKAFKFAAGADSAEKVRTEILKDGTRKPFAVIFANEGGEALPHISDIAPWIKSPDGAVHASKDDKIVDEKSDKNKRIAHLRCTICDFSQQYDAADQGKRRMAMARMTRHLKTAKTNLNRHRVLLARIGH